MTWELPVPEKDCMYLFHCKGRPRVCPCIGRFPHVVIALFIFIGLSCAKQGYPPGGTVDKEPPYLVSSVPPAMMTEVSTTEPIVFEFSESMNQESVEDNLFIIPIPSSWPELSWKSRGRILILKQMHPLRDNTTYVISIGAKASDLRRNPLKESIMLSFSTGNVIENGKIKGNIIPYTFFSESGESVSGVDVVAFQMNELSHDPDPRKNVPDFVTQTGSDGKYEIVGLSTGTYRLFAIDDKDHNGFYSEGYDLIGIAPYDVIIAEGDSVGLAPQIAISTKDTTSIQLVSIRVPGNRSVEVFFDREIDPETFVLEFDELNILGWFIPFSRPQMFSVATEIQEDKKQYTVTRLVVSDREGNHYQPMEVVPYFTGTGQPDTTALKIVHWQPKILTRRDDHIVLYFNRILDLPDNPEDMIMSADASPVPAISAKRTEPNILEIIPIEKWQEDHNYTFSLNTDRLRDIAGNKLSDDGAQFNFRVVSVDTLGYIEGDIEDHSLITGQKYNYRLIFKNLDTDTVTEFTVQGEQKWSTGPVLPGRYSSLCYRDEDNNESLYRGSVYPYKTAEQVFALSDTILVTSRWTNGGNTFIFR